MHKAMKWTFEGAGSLGAGLGVSTGSACCFAYECWDPSRMPWMPGLLLVFIGIGIGWVTSSLFAGRFPGGSTGALALILLAASCVTADAQQLPPPEQQPIQQPMYQPPAPRPIPVGAVLVSRWFDERNNDSIGYWNHLCMYVGDGMVIESQQGIGVQQITWEQYRARPQHVLVLFPRTPELGEMAAMRARSQVGTPYRRFSSVLPFIDRGGMNCVSQVCDAYTIGGYRPRISRPDDAFWEANVFAANYPQQQYQQGQR